MNAFDGWDPGTYNQFAVEREQPFWDLVELLESFDAERVVDLGCGDGRLTASLSEYIGSHSMLGIDSSSAMIKEAQFRSSERVRFEVGDIGGWEQADSYDLIFANASLQWVPDHAATLTRWSRSLRQRGQLAVQVPANADHPSHRVAGELAQELLDDPPPDVVTQNVLAPEIYAGLLDELGFRRQHVRLQVYVHHLPSTSDVVDWVKGTTLTRFKEPLGDAGWNRFIELYRERLLAELGDRSPFVYPFKRILIWGRRD
jgi:trans-aconitate 2-methyltransferase